MSDTNDKFFGAIEKEEQVLDKDVLSDALSADDEVAVGATIVDEQTNEEVINAPVEAQENTPLTLPYSAISYFKNPETGMYHLVSIGFNPITKQVGSIEVDPNRFAMDRASIESEFKIKVAREIFSR